MPGSRKKTITIGSSILFILISLHLIGVYIFSGGHYEGVRGGSISIGIVDTVPNAMNPFQYGTNHNSDLLYRFLFRGLIKYNIATGIYQGDLTSCDISNISKVICTMRDDAVWSDGTRVKTEDIIASIEAFKQNSSQEEMRNFLETVKVVKNGDNIEIQSNQKSPHMVEILTYPIVKADVITLINSGTINEKNYITSGPYILGESILDKEYGFDRITLLRNEKFSQSTWLDKIHFKFFRDLSSLERSAETLTMVIPPVKNENIDIGPRFREYIYTNYEYFSVFINTKSLGRILRNSIHWQIGTSFSGNIADDHKRIDTLFPTGGPLLPTGNMKAFPDILRDLGYTKKSEILTKMEQTSTLVSGELVIPTTKYWTNKSNVSTLFIDEIPEEIIFTGKVPPNTESVTINGYTLKEFIPGNTIFAYKVSQAMGSLKEGKNEYNLVLQLGNAKNDTELLTVYAATGSGKLEEYKKQLQDEYSATQNTPALVATRERTKQDKINQIRELQDEYYFNNKNEIFVIKIGYIIGPQSTEVYAKRIDEALKLLGIKTELIPYSAKDIQAIITSGERKYDLLVIGISVEGSLASIGKLFSSTDSKSSGLNFSNVENRTLDNLFAELRGTTEFDKIEKIEQSISKIMNAESFFVPISSPYHRIWVDRNIKGMPKIEVIPDIAAFVDVFVGTSIKENYIRNMNNKNITGFFHWIVSQF